MHRIEVIALLVTACGRYRFDGSDGSSERFPHITTAAGWTVDVLNDCSDQLTYAAVDFVDGAEMYSNAPTAMFATRAPYPEVLVVAAGRDLVEVSATSCIVHHFGMHAPNSANYPDMISDGVWTDTLNAGKPLVLISSTSDSGGDGTFAISTQWQSTSDRATNNTRTIAWDATGAFGGGAAELYLGTSTGVFRRSDNAMILATDTVSLRSVGSDLYLSRRYVVDVDERLIRVMPMVSGMYPEAELAQAGVVEIGEGRPPAPAVAWVMLDRARLGAITPTNTVEMVAESTDPDYRWQVAVTPPPGHALATAPNLVYVLETNRALDIDRVLVLTMQ